MCLSRQGESNVMQHDLFRSGRDLELRSNVEFDLLRSFTSHSTRLDERNAMVIKVLS